MTEEELFHAALAKPEQERSAFLDEACSGNAALRASVEALLAAHASAGSFLNTAALDANPNKADLAATIDSHVGAESKPSDNAGSAAASRKKSRTRDDREPNDSQSQSTTTILPGSAGATLDGRYTLLEKIGEGGMGEVWVAKQTEPVKRKVALKLIKKGMDSRAVLQRFEQERQALALMDHPNIARVLDGGMTPTGQPYFAMELVNGLPLTKLCDEMKLTLNQRLELFVPICQAVQHAHQKGIVHRDLKPANILVTMIDGRPVPKVIDFGVAKATAGKLTAETMSTGFGSVVGTLEYMSPEQAAFSGEDIDTRADIYSLGVILYELLTGLRPIDANRLRKAALTEMMRIIREEEPSKPSTRLSTNESLPSLAAIRQIEPKKLTALLRGELDWVVMKCLEKHRDRRYETANALARDVQRYLADEAVEARPPSAAYRLQKFVTRNKASVVAVSAVAASLLVGLVGFAWQAHVASEQRDLAIEAEKSESTQRVLAEKARDAEAKALKVSERALFESRHNAARLAYERAQALCEEGEADVGLLEMARSLEMTPEGDLELDRAIRTSMNLWAGQLNLIHHRFKPRENTMQNLEDLAVSPDGLSMLLVDVSAGAQIVETQTGKLLCALAYETNEPVRDRHYRRGIFSPNGRYVSVSCHDDPIARIWDAATGALVGNPMNHDFPITGLCFDVNSEALVTCTGTTIHFWNIADGTRIGDSIVLEQNAYGVDISTDGKKLLAWTDSPGKVFVWDYPARELAYTLDGIDFNVSSASFSPDNQWIFAMGFIEQESQLQPFAAQFWDAQTGQPVGQKMRSESEAYSADGFNHRASFRPDSQVVVAGGEPIRMWRVPTGSPLGAAANAQNGRRPSFLPNRQQFAVADGFYLDRIDAAPLLTSTTVANIFDPKEQGLIGFRRDALHIAPDGRTAVVTIHDQTQVFFRLIHLQSGTAIGDPDTAPGYVPDNGWVPAPSFSVDGKSVATVVEENACQVLDTSTGKERLNRLRMESRIMAVAFSPDGKLLATGDIEGKVRIWNASTGEPMGPPFTQASAVNQVCFSPDSKRILTGGGLTRQLKGDARLWDVATGQPLGPALDLLGPVTSVAFSPDGNTFATGAWQVALWDTASSRNRWSTSAAGRTDRLQFSPDGQRILARHDEQKAIRIYDTHSGAPTTPPMSQQSDVLSTDLSPVGQLALTSAAGRKIRLWDTLLGLPVGPEWSGCNGGLAAFSPNGKSLYFIDEFHRLMRRDISEPLEGTPERIRLAIEAGTMLSLDPFGVKVGLFPKWQFDPITKSFKLGPDPLEPVEKRLKELGGPMGNLER